MFLLTRRASVAFARSRFDALGRLEAFSEDLAAIARTMGDTDATPYRVRKRNKKTLERHGTCGEVDMTNSSVLQRICRLYVSDFDCFNYARPAACLNI